MLQDNGMNGNKSAALVKKVDELRGALEEKVREFKKACEGMKFEILIHLMHSCNKFETRASNRH